MTSRPTLSELENVLKIAAKAVVLYGQIYLPIFDRLRGEVENMKAEHTKENLAILLAKKYAETE